MDQTPIIGIDLGTTYSCVCAYVNKKVEIVRHYEGNNTIPSCVAFTDTERLIGDAAMKQAQQNPQNTVFDVKRLIGRNYSESTVQQDIKLWPFKVEASVNDKPMIVIKYKGENKKFYPEEISSMVLTKIKKNAEAYLDQQISQAVISVPAYFNTFQRQATKDAGTIAGLKVLRIINEPSAAAIAYDLYNKSSYEKKILIFDLGGGTLDVSLLSIEVGVVEVRATAGDTHLGGEDFDNKLVEYCCNEFLKKKGIDIRGNPRALRRLRTQCERAKRVLSSANQTTIEVDSLEDNEDFICTISRSKFEELCMDLFKKCIDSVENVFQDSRDSKNYTEVVLVGGSTRIPKIQELLREYFDGKELNQSINPDEAVAYGAAIYAANLTGKTDFDYLILDIIPQSLGIEIDGGIMATVASKQTTIPTKKKTSFKVNCKDENQFQVKIFEGNGNFVHDCKKLVQFDLHGIQRDLEGKIEIEVEFEIDENQLMIIFIKDKVTKTSIKIDYTNFEFNLSQYEIKNLVKQAEKFDDVMPDKVLSYSKYQYPSFFYEKLPPGFTFGNCQLNELEYID